MNGFRTALIVCGILIMAFVMLWTKHQQRTFDRRGTSGRMTGGDVSTEAEFTYHLDDDKSIVPGRQATADTNGSGAGAKSSPILSAGGGTILGTHGVESDDEQLPVMGLDTDRTPGADSDTDQRINSREADRNEPPLVPTVERPASAESDQRAPAGRERSNRWRGRFRRRGAKPDVGGEARDAATQTDASRLTPTLTRSGTPLRLGDSNAPLGPIEPRAQDKKLSADQFSLDQLSLEVTAPVGESATAAASDGDFRDGSQAGESVGGTKGPSTSPDSDRQSVRWWPPYRRRSNSKANDNDASFGGARTVTHRDSDDSGRLGSRPDNMHNPGALGAAHSADTMVTQSIVMPSESIDALNERAERRLNPAGLGVLADNGDVDSDRQRSVNKTADRDETKHEGRSMFRRSKDRRRAAKVGQSQSQGKMERADRHRGNALATGASMWGSAAWAQRGAERRTLPVNSDKGAGFGSRYGRAHKRARNRTQAVRDSSLPSRTQSRSATVSTDQETGVFAGLLGRLSSVVGRSTPQRNKRQAPVRHPLERNLAPAPREPRLTANDAGPTTNAGTDPVPGANVDPYADRLDQGAHLGSGDNFHNIDQVHVGGARTGVSSTTPSRPYPGDGGAADLGGQGAGHYDPYARDSGNYAGVRAGDYESNHAAPSYEGHTPQFDLSAIDTARQIDQIAQIVELGRSVTADDVLAEYRLLRDGVGKPVRIIGLADQSGSWIDLERGPAHANYHEIVLTVQLMDENGPITQSGLHQFSDIVLKSAARIGGRPRFAMAFDDALNHAHRLEQFCKDYDRLAILSVIANIDGGIRSEPLKEFAETHQLAFNSMNIFHQLNPDAEGSPWRFGVANLFEPGTFSLDPHSDFSTRGVRLFMSIPTVRNPDRVFDDMLATAHGLCINFEGTIVDQNKRPLTAQGISDIREQMVAVINEMRTQGFAPGDETTVRLFPAFGQL